MGHGASRNGIALTVGKLDDNTKEMLVAASLAENMIDGVSAL